MSSTSATEAISTVSEIAFAVDGISSGITPAAAEIANKVTIEVDKKSFIKVSPFTQAFKDQQQPPPGDK